MTTSLLTTWRGVYSVAHLWLCMHSTVVLSSSTSIPYRANSAHWMNLPHLPLFASESIVCHGLNGHDSCALTILWWKMCCAAAASRSCGVNGAVSLRLTSSNALAQFSWKFPKIQTRNYTKIMFAQHRISLMYIQVRTSKYMLCHLITWFAWCFFLPGLGVFFKTVVQQRIIMNNQKSKYIQRIQKISEMWFTPSRLRRQRRLTRSQKWTNNERTTTVSRILSWVKFSQCGCGAIREHQCSPTPGCLHVTVNTEGLLTCKCNITPLTSRPQICRHVAAQQLARVPHPHACFSSLRRESVYRSHS